MQDYKIIQRQLTGGPTLLNTDGSIIAQNMSEFMTYVNQMYLTQGYTIHTITLLHYTPGSDAGPTSSEYAYHLVKEVPEPKNKDK